MHADRQDCPNRNHACREAEFTFHQESPLSVFF
jgi:hypothetical protein